MLFARVEVVRRGRIDRPELGERMHHDLVRTDCAQRRAAVGTSVSPDGARAVERAGERGEAPAARSGADTGQALARIVSNEIERRGTAPERPLVVRGALLQAGRSNAGLRGPGAALRQQTVEVLLAIRLIDPETGEIVAAFDAPGSASEVGADVDFVRALISVERNDDDWRRSPMGLAIHRAALRVAEEAAQWSELEEP